jgi:hypothetical protein
MATFLRDSVTRVWLLLLLITAGSWAVGAHVVLGDRANHLLVLGTILLLTCIKMYLVIRHFMEVKSAPLLLKYACNSWLAVVFWGLFWLYH